MPPKLVPGQKVVIDESGLTSLFTSLREAGYRIIGPRLRDGAIVYDDLSSPEDLPRGRTDEQAPGHYRVKPRPDSARFGFAVGPTSWKRFLHEPSLQLWKSRREGADLKVETTPPSSQRMAFVGVRACELAAMAIQDRVFVRDAVVDVHYASRRQNSVTIAVNCSTPAATCFCTSMGTGPAAKGDYDLALTELIDDGPWRLLAEIGTLQGAGLLARAAVRVATEVDLAAATAVVQKTCDTITRRVDTNGLRETLYARRESSRWEEIANRCLACSNCTMVCPTCFCTSVEDHTDLTTQEATRTRTWDSCFTTEFSHVHGGNVRTSRAARYRQWLTHKFASWHDQFGTSGCVGCGRCVAWCPAAIDVTTEIQHFQEEEKS